MFDLSKLAISPASLGARLKRARSSRGLTQEQAASTVGLARTTLVAIEKGDRVPSATELNVLAKLYQTELGELVGRRAIEESFVPQFRAAVGGSPVAEPALEATSRLERYAANYVALEETNAEPSDRHYPPLMPLPAETADAEQVGEELAASERSRLGLGDVLVFDLRAILEEVVGLRVFVFPMAGAISGIFAYNDRLGGCIAANANHPPERRRWTFAHECAHFLTTRFEPDLFLLPGTRWGKPVAEKLADAFATHFLMPRQAVNRRFTEMTSARTNPPVVADLLKLAHYFGVSVQAMALRLEDLRRIPVGSWNRLRAHGLKPETARANLGLSTAAPEDERFPSRYRLLAKRAFDAELISERALARYFDTDLIGAREELEKLEQLEINAEVPQGGLDQPVSA